MRTLSIVSFLYVTTLLTATLPTHAANDRDTKIKNDRTVHLANGYWIYNNLDKGIALAKKTGKPLLVTFRCIPCHACAGFDAKIANRDERVKAIMDKFICVRIIYANNIDLKLFEFDTDLSYTAFFMNADKTIYGRFGTRSDMKDTERDISVESFRASLLAALEVHKNYPANRATLKRKQRQNIAPFRYPHQYPALRKKYKPEIDYKGRVTQSCIHCHQIGDADRQMLFDRRKPLPPKLRYPYPMPSVIGINLSPKHTAKITSITPDSPAERAALKPNDLITRINNQPILSIADIQYILHNAADNSRLLLQVQRENQIKKFSLVLPKGWRKKTDISWRVSTWPLRRMATGGIYLVSLTADEYKKYQLSTKALALRAQHVGQYGAHAAAKRAGFKKNDIIISFDNQSKPMTETEFILYALRYPPGTKIPVTVLRNNRKIKLKLPRQK